MYRINFMLRKFILKQFKVKQYFYLQPSHLEHLCINLCAETMQHFYNIHIFKSSTESCKEEGIKPDVEIDYSDNVPCIDFISSLVTNVYALPYCSKLNVCKIVRFFFNFIFSEPVF